MNEKKEIDNGSFTVNITQRNELDSDFRSIGISTVASILITGTLGGKIVQKRLENNFQNVIQAAHWVERIKTVSIRFGWGCSVLIDIPFLADKKEGSNE